MTSLALVLAAGNPHRALVAGCSLGLALLAKPTALAAPPAGGQGRCAGGAAPI